MERLWSPWRLPYVIATGSTGGCIFCDAAGTGADRAIGSGGGSNSDLVLVRARRCYVILNLYPYNNGHLMVVPNRHVGTLHAAAPDELSELIRLTRHAEIALAEAYNPQGINVGLNLGRPAGAGVVDHLHVHVVPRWTGDTNFMSVVGNVRVLPEELGETAKRLGPIFARLAREEEAQPTPLTAPE
jgi:ATP adenylyltransferase